MFGRRSLIFCLGVVLLPAVLGGQAAGDREAVEAARAEASALERRGAYAEAADAFARGLDLDPANGTTSEGYSMAVVWDINDDWQFKSITAHRESDTKNNIDFDTTPARIACTNG